MNQILTRPPGLFSVRDIRAFKTKALRWAQQFEVVCALDSNAYQKDRYTSWDGLIAVGVKDELIFNQHEGDPFSALKKYYEQNKSWLFGYLSYDLKNNIEDLSSENNDEVGLPNLHFFRPQYLIKIFPGYIEIKSEAELPHIIYDQIFQLDDESEDRGLFSSQLQLKSRIEKADYLRAVEQIQKHLHEGDIYEMNFCQEFYLENVQPHPVNLFERLNGIAKAPFSAFYRLRDQYLLCASPERFLKKEGRKLISQPIKGTMKRGVDQEEDQQLKEALLKSQKNRSENVMIVDLVRNDLAKSCEAGSVKVEELFGIYPFEQVLHMISTITGTIRKDLHFTDAIKNAFPMGSMTGAPKISSMQLIEKYEQSKRGLYSGSVGYITPEGDFDFNVVIRSMLYNAAKAYLSFQVGGAIVYDSTPDNEYEECLLKAKGVMKAIGINPSDF